MYLSLILLFSTQMMMSLQAVYKVRWEGLRRCDNFDRGAGKDRVTSHFYIFLSYMYKYEIWNWMCCLTICCDAYVLTEDGTGIISLVIIILHGILNLNWFPSCRKFNISTIFRGQTSRHRSAILIRNRRVCLEGRSFFTLL